MYKVAQYVLMIFLAGSVLQVVATKGNRIPSI